jgi:penicillin amidase
LDGESAYSGLRDPVEVLFDPSGVPHVYARDPEDAWFAAGVMHARDRLWQMELYRRATSGRLSELLGEATLPIDKRMLTLGLRAAADAEWSRATAEVKNALERYAAGVNAVLGGVTTFRQRPIEMQILGFTPAPWTPQDTMAVGRLLAWRLAENHQSELVRGALAERFGIDSARLLGGRYPADAPTILGGTVPAAPARLADGGGIPAARMAQLARAVQTPRRKSVEWPRGLEWLHPMARRGNSNNWVVAPSRSATGRPILANDPHLQIEFPGAWYEMHLVAAGLDVIGVTVPGVPFVVIGHNGQIAWGFTNSGADVQDLYLERVDVGRRRYQTPGGWQPVDVTRIEIPVRGRRVSESFDVWKTDHGPIFADATLDWTGPPAWMTPMASASTEQMPTSPVTAYALRWDTARGDIAAAFERFNRASDWPTFLEAVDGFSVPSQNIVYADVEGNIGYAMSGRVPVRASGDGTFPSDGASGAGGWSGSAEGAALPRAFNPASGFVASSNNEVDRRSPVMITRDWAAPFRAERMREVLSNSDKLTLEVAAALQNDRRSLAAERVLAGVSEALDLARASGADRIVVETLSRLAQWDHIVDGRPVVTLYEAFEDALWRRTFMDEMDEPLFRVFYEWAGADRPAGLYAIIDDRQARWFDDVGTVEKREARADIYVLAAQDAGERVTAEFGSESNQAWDRVHAATFEHPLGASRALGWFLNGGTASIAGDGSTVMRVSWNRLRPFAAWELPSWRQILDVGAWDQSRVILPTGQSGHMMSGHRFDQNADWRAGRYRPQPFTREAVEAVRAHRLLLSPR